MSVERIVLWRHGETDYNAVGRMQGHLDSALTEVGWNQARFAVAALARFEPDLVIASDLRRATDTATVLTDAIGVPLRLDKRLRETHLGEWQGMTGSEVDEQSPGERDRWRLDATWAPPGGESRVDVAERAGEVVTDLLRDDEEYGTVLLAAHGGLILALTAYLVDLPVERWPSLGGIGNCHWVDLRRRDDRWRLQAYNAGMTG
ncbi:MULTISPECIES: histidine phosphatase family protein [Prauserella salsuginis group]|uniref:phosphoglycerate mutase (2,3-diphosphoglycerate-dependent) n=2 Tax=Prauserella salsuginis group TaxID=2893672 RepID=A0A839XCX2_9PSEU|nr:MULTISPECIES: histidine phosphatase family protein [Prauserella salsuginis group]MBB3661110.1 2,3-bisphosphoglycerate-dependent phosphoglycerate mutase/probable phosphoglycerate mutase [Prauserella sediminis]MCR3718975.1 glucosyl-3-phosphoglycerate phosphatase (pgm family) [Prauserella flava]MCR3733545.1 glucosyl-3-phosphoglycerate phosphatase (pgm family) [Prauserella salsuginis]